MTTSPAAAMSEADPTPSAVVISVSALEAAVGADVAADAGADVAAAGKLKVFSEEEEEERICRICHLSPDRAAGEVEAELMQLGCGCKSDLGTAHRDCAETWFRIKGNRCCEICGMNAKNVKGEDDGSFMEEWHDRRMASSGYRNGSERVGCWRGQPFCNFLMACLVIAFILPWFFRVNMF